MIIQIKTFSKISYVMNYDGNTETLGIILIFYLVYLCVDRFIIFKIIDDMYQKKSRISRLHNS